MLTPNLPPLKGSPYRSPTSLAARPTGWSLLDSTADFPAIVLKGAALANNIAAMSTYCRENRVSLAPHWKTTMSPELLERQFAAGAWAATVANAWQCRVARSLGVQRVLIANEVVDPAAIRWLYQEITAEAACDVYLYVDSVAGIDVIEESFASGHFRPLQVLIEIGYEGGRGGCRGRAEALELAERASESAAVTLRGVAGFEGLLKGTEATTVEAGIHAFLSSMRQTATDMQHSFASDPAEWIVSAGGSGYFDLVVENLGQDRFEFPVRTVLRSGCYVTHDSGMYKATSPLDGRRPTDELTHLEPAIELWASVHSRPESSLAIVGFGKRDAPYDYERPTPQRVRGRRSGHVRSVAETFQVTDLNDQHCFLEIPTDDSLAVGDIVIFGISHPCGVFDKWRTIPIVDDEYRVIDSVTSYL